jgi:hypothetical protein
MNDSELTAPAAQVKKLTGRVEAPERLLERILRQKPVSERQLERALKSRGELRSLIRRGSCGAAKSLSPSQRSLMSRQWSSVTAALGTNQTWEPRWRMSAFGRKQTLVMETSMSANDPKRTFSTGQVNPLSNNGPALLMRSSHRARNSGSKNPGPVDLGHAIHH